MVVGFTTICAIIIYHHWIYDFLPIYLMATCTRYYVIKFVSHLWRFGGFLHQCNWPQRYSWNIVESGTKYHKPIYYFSESYLWWYYKRVLVKSTLFFIYCGLTSMIFFYIVLFMGILCFIINKNVDIKISAHDAFLE